jgi:hypothetical protein
MFKTCFAEFSKLIQEIAELKTKDVDEEVCELNSKVQILIIQSLIADKEKDCRKACSGIFDNR